MRCRVNELFGAGVIVILATAMPAMGAGPFGSESGITKDQVIKLVGEGAVKKAEKGSTEDISILSLATAPRPHPDFEEYVLLFSPEKGLLKVIAVGKTLQTNGFGSEVHSAFVELRDAVAKIYGSPKNYDYLRSGSIWKESEDWMMGLLKKERHLFASWDSPPILPNHIANVELEALGLSTEKGYLVLRYEFEGFGEFMDSQKAKAATVF